MLIAVLLAQLIVTSRLSFSNVCSPLLGSMYEWRSNNSSPRIAVAEYIPVSEWMMEKEGSKRVEIAGINDKRQITAVFARSLTADFLPVQLVYKGTTTKCLSSISFPPKWHITATHNHWCNEDTMVEYISKIIFPYLQEKKATLKLPPTLHWLSSMNSVVKLPIGCCHY